MMISSCMLHQDLYYSGLLSIESLSSWGSLKPRQRRELFAGLLETLQVTVEGVTTYTAVLEAEVEKLEASLDDVHTYASSLEEESRETRSQQEPTRLELGDGSATASASAAATTSSSFAHSGTIPDTNVLVLAAAEIACQERTNQAARAMADLRLGMATLASSNHSLSRQLEAVDSDWSACELDLAKANMVSSPSAGWRPRQRRAQRGRNGRPPRATTARPQSPLLPRRGVH